MDYCQLLFKAQENKLNASAKEVRCYNTSFTAPKKLEKSRVSSENIQKFLARKEEAEKQKLLEAKRRKDELLALRSQDRKAQKRVQVMLKRTKSANKSVMEDAIDNVNTADTLAGPVQCDEDDYGYVSQEASAYYNKLMDKYQNMPAENNFAQKKSEVKDLNAAKNRVKAALLKEAEDELLPHKRKRKRKNMEESSLESCLSPSDELKEYNELEDDSNEGTSKCIDILRKSKKLMPPPMDFGQLLKIAEQKQHEPIVIEKAETYKEPERLMTKKEKIDYLKEKERRAQKGLGLPEGIIYGESKRPDPYIKRPLEPKKVNSSESENITEKQNIRPAQNDISPTKNNSSSAKTQEKTIEQKLLKNSDVWSKPSNSSIKNFITGARKTSNKPISEMDQKIPKSDYVSKNQRKSEEINIDQKIKNQGKDMKDRTSAISKKTGSLKNSDPLDELSDIDREIELLRRKRELLASRMSAPAKIDSVKPKLNNSIQPKVNNLIQSKVSNPIQSKINSPIQPKVNSPIQPKIDSPIQPKINSLIQPKVIDSTNNINKTKQGKMIPLKLESPKGKVALKNMKFKQPPATDMKRAKMKRRPLDSDSEFDSEMDDFIDDEPNEETDISKHIRDIFGYDKSRYRDMDEGEECMVSNFAQQMKEEFVSTKIGIMEDLEDIRKEQVEKAKRKKMKHLKVKR